MRSKILLTLQASFLMATLSGCEGDERLLPAAEGSAEVADTGMIVVAGGMPDGALQTRNYYDPATASSTANWPSLSGVCLADKMLVWTYSSSDAGSFQKKITDLTNTAQSTIDVANTTRVGRWTTHSITHSNSAALYFCYMVRGLAYRSLDEGLFTAAMGADPSKPTVTLLPKDGLYTTPELFYGLLKFNTSTISASSESFDTTSGLIKFHGNDRKSYTLPLTGTLLRIVSQFNITLTSVPPNTTKAELMVGTLPTQTTLNGSHSAFYPVNATPGATAADAVVASTTDFADGKLHLSTFMLPSYTGTTLKVRLHLLNTDSSESIKDFEIEPSANVLLGEANSTGVYTGTPASLKVDGRCVLYSALGHTFYSYSNVRTNITGEYGETHIVDIKLEVEPGYEKEHSITLK